MTPKPKQIPANDFVEGIRRIVRRVKGNTFR